MLESTDKDVSSGSSSESEDKNAPGMYKNNYTYVCTYVSVSVHMYVYKIAVVMNGTCIIYSLQNLPTTYLYNKKQCVLYVFTSLRIWYSYVNGYLCLVPSS